MGKKRVKMVLFLLTLLVITACTKEKKIEGAFAGGTTGLGANFLESEPPERVLDNNAEDFAITVSLFNDGESDVGAKNARITLVGVDAKDFQIKDMTKTNENLIRGVSKERDQVIPGDIEEVSFDAKYKNDLDADFNAIIGANLCYKYGTRAVSNLCLKRAIGGRQAAGDICVVDEPKSIESSSAPIQITNLIERPVGKNSLRVMFDIENAGKGTTYEKGAFATGSCYEDKTREDKVNVDVGVVGKGLNFKCSKLDNRASGSVKLIDGRTTVNCEASTAGLQETAFESQLSINLGYVYKDYIETNVIVEAIG